MEESLDAADAARLEVLRGALEEGCGVLRDEAGLREALGALTSLSDGLAAAGRMRTFLGRAALVARSLAESALLRTESRGDHFRVDHPHRDDRRWLGNLVTRLGEDGAAIETTFQPAGIGRRAAAPDSRPTS